VDWDKSGSNLIAYDKKGANGYYDVWLMTPAGVDVTSLTAGNASLPGKHAGNPAWHPGGKLIVFQAERATFPTDSSATPGLGIGNDLWFARADGSQFWRMDTVTVGGYARPPGILHPHFSHAGTLLTWAEYVGPSGTFGEWRLKLADFSLAANGTPSVSNVRTYNPGNGQNLFETHTFSPDDTRFLYTSTKDSFLEIYSFEVATGISTRLTNDPAAWDEHAQYTPDGQSIIWMSSHGLTTVGSTYPTDYWAMDANGANTRRISWFNLSGHQHYLGQTPTVAGDFAWSPDGTQMVGYVQAGVGTTGVSSYNVLITFARSTPAQALPASAEIIYTAPVPSELDAGGFIPQEIYAMDTNGNTVTRLTFSRGTNIHCAVSPDRTKIATSRVTADTNASGTLDAGDDKDLWVLDLVTGTEQDIVSTYDTGLGGVDWAADSQNIYCSMTQSYTNYDIYRVTPSGSAIAPVTTTLLSQLGLAGTRKWVSDVSVSPDGQWLAFIFAQASGASGFVRKTQVGICHTDGTQARLITDGGPLTAPTNPPGVGDFDPELSPDNQTLVFQRATNVGLIGGERTGDITTARVSDGALATISPANQNAISGIPDWSLDGRILYTEWNPALNRVGPVLARTDGSLLRRLDWGVSGTHFKWITPAWPRPQVTLQLPSGAQATLTSTLPSSFLYQLQSSTDLQNWQPQGAPQTGNDATLIVPLTLGSNPKGFFRWQMIAAPRDITQ
jgi:Tol biopolymer transport system component